MNYNKIIYPLNGASWKEANDAIELMKNKINIFKVGWPLYLASGTRIIDSLKENNCQIILDLKLFDVPETIKLAIRQLTYKGIDFITIHGNDPIVASAIKEKSDLKILVDLSIYTFSYYDLKELNANISIDDLVYHRAIKTLKFDCDGIVYNYGLRAKSLKTLNKDKIFIFNPENLVGGMISREVSDQEWENLFIRMNEDNADYIVSNRKIME